MMRLIKLCCFVLMLGTLTGCSHLADKEPTLYAQLGGKDGIATIVNQFLFRVADDDRILHYFYGADILRLERLLAEYIGEVSGGPEPYSGEDLAISHAGMYITEAAFYAVVENFLNTMEALEIPLGAQNELIARLAPVNQKIISYRRETQANKRHHP